MGKSHGGIDVNWDALSGLGSFWDDFPGRCPRLGLDRAFGAHARSRGKDVGNLKPGGDKDISRSVERGTSDTTGYE